MYSAQFIIFFVRYTITKDTGWDRTLSLRVCFDTYFIFTFNYVQVYIAEKNEGAIV